MAANKSMAGRRWVTLVICSVVFFGLGIATQNRLLGTVVNPGIQPKAARSYTTHATIAITGDAGLASFPGSGTSADDPKVIEGYNITSLVANDKMIEISDTRLNVTIRNCWFGMSGLGVQGQIGIHLVNATNVTVINCIFSDTTGGAFPDSTYGMLFGNCTDLLIDGNTFTGVYEGLHNGISGWYNDTRVTISNNLILNAQYCGILWYQATSGTSSYGNLSGNYVYRPFRGINIDTMTNTTLSYNTVYKAPNSSYSLIFSANTNLVQIANVVILPPTVSLVASAANNATPTTLTAVVSGGVSPYTYQLKFGDGTANVTSSSAAHNYTAGSYTAEVTVTDGDGDVAYTNTAVVATNLVPSCPTCPSGSNQNSTPPPSGIPGYPLEVVLFTSICGFSLVCLTMRRKRTIQS